MNGKVMRNPKASPKLNAKLNPFDCVSPFGVGCDRWALGFMLAMVEALIVLFGVISAGIFIAHAIDSYRSRL